MHQWLQTVLLHPLEYGLPNQESRNGAYAAAIYKAETFAKADPRGPASTIDYIIQFLLPLRDARKGRKGPVKQVLSRPGGPVSCGRCALPSLAFTSVVISRHAASPSQRQRAVASSSSLRRRRCVVLAWLGKFPKFSTCLNGSPAGVCG